MEFELKVAVQEIKLFVSVCLGSDAQSDARLSDN